MPVLPRPGHEVSEPVEELKWGKLDDAADFQRFWEYTSPAWATKFLDAWCTRTMRSRIGPMQKIARSLRRHRHLILNWSRAHGTISSGVVEGFNGKATPTTRKAFGFRTPKGIEIALFHVLGRLPEPMFTHRFC